MATRIQLRRGTAEQWSTTNPVLTVGEIGIELDTLKFKIGNGLNWNSITSYANVTPSSLSNNLSEYILASTQGSPGGPAELNSSGDLIIPENSVILWNDADYDYTTTLTATQPTTDRTITIPNATGTIALTSDITQNNSDIGLKTNNLESVVTGIEQVTVIDTASDSGWRTLKYLLQMTYSGEIHSTEVIIANDGTNLLISQYGDVFSSTELAAVTADKNNGIINLKVTPAFGKTPLTVRFFRTGIKA